MPKSTNVERERRILDSAADLFVHYGYDKTAVNDIARAAGVSQGTMYLHFANKDELLERLIVREMEVFAQAWLERVEADPEGGRIGGMYKNMLYALSSSPFLAATFRQDGRVFGNYMRKPDNVFRRMQEGQAQSPRHLFVQRMQEAGALRTDISADVITHIMNMLAFGLVGMDGVVPSHEMPPLDDLIEGIATIMDRALTPEGGVDGDVGKTIIRQIFEAAREQVQQMEESEQENEVNP
ncbi:MAG: TetR/AcrR family transcriptional regulator [Anaerolineae bacterium]|nr:TetR/AcrR family transcriptional regulator [Anaerolineae bacterium]